MSNKANNPQNKSLSYIKAAGDTFPWYECAFYFLAPILICIPFGYALKFNSISIVICSVLSVLSQLTLTVFGPLEGLLILAGLAFVSSQFFGFGNYVEVGLLAASSIPLVWSSIAFIDLIAKKMNFKFR